jgi:hypothetical protein
MTGPAIVELLGQKRPKIIGQGLAMRRPGLDRGTGQDHRANKGDANRERHASLRQGWRDRLSTDALQGGFGGFDIPYAIPPTGWAASTFLQQQLWFAR